jgi:hypothetical protein
MTQKSLSGRADEQGTAQVQEGVHIIENFQIVAISLAKADARVQNQEIPGQAMGQGEFQPFLKEGAQFPDEIIIMGISLHIFGSALHVHKNDGNPCFPGQMDHIRIEAQGTDIIDNVRTCLQSGLRHPGFVGVNGNGDWSLGPNPFNNRENPTEFF